MIDIDEIERIAKAGDPWGYAATPANVLALIAEVRALRAELNDFTTECGNLNQEVVNLRGLLDAIPKTPEAAIAFIGPNFNSMQAQGWTEELPTEPTGDLSMVPYSLTVHDLLSAFSWAGLSPEDIDAARKEPQCAG